jgi:hypothetical protein
MAGLSAQMVKRTLAHTGLTLSGAGGGWLAAIAAGATTKAIVIAAVVAGGLIANSVAKIVETISNRPPETIRAEGDKKAKIIEAQSEAQALIMRTQAFTDVLRAGLDPDKVESSGEMLRMSSINADLPARRRLKDELLAKLLAAAKARSSASSRPDSGGGPQDGESGGGPKSVVRQIRVARADPPELQANENPLDPGDDSGSTTPPDKTGLP